MGQFYMVHVRRQYSVGQGFFHGGLIEILDHSNSQTRFNYIYDCGSFNTRRLEACICESTAYYYNWPRINVDMLILSHMHKDHVNGLDYLLKKNVTIDTVVLPYLNPTERLLLLAQHTQDDSDDPDDPDDPDGVTHNYIKFIANPSFYLREKGVRNVLFIKSGNGEPGREPPLIINDDNNLHNELSLKIDWRHVTNYQEKMPTSTHSDDILVSDRVVVPILANNLTCWRFRFHADSKGRNVSEFVDMLCRNRFDPEILNNIQELINSLPDLKRLYSQFVQNSRGDLNTTSLSCFSGPLLRSDAAWFNLNLGLDNCFVHWQEVFGLFRLFGWIGRNDDQCLNLDRGSDCIGWLGTGDAELQNCVTREDFFNKFVPILNQVHTLTIPHHGSNNNFHSDIISRLNPKICVISAGNRSRYSHPHQNVVNAIQMQAEIRIVTDEINSDFCELFFCLNPF